MTASATTAPIDVYRDPAVYDRERVVIFARTWQFLGLEADLVRPGDYLAETLAGYPIVVVRDEAQRGRRGREGERACGHQRTVEKREARGHELGVTGHRRDAGHKRSVRA